MATRIVVGVDGSDNSVDALRWALEEAERRHTTVEAVIAWQLPTWFVLEVGHRVEFARLGTELEQQARATHPLAVAAAGSGHGSVHVEQIVVQQPAAKALLDIAAGAELLVIGSRGLGGFKGLLLGSVSSQCVLHAPCPVAVVR